MADLPQHAQLLLPTRQTVRQEQLLRVPRPLERELQPTVLLPV